MTDADELRARRARLKLPMRLVAKATGVATSTIVRIEAGKRSMSDTIAKLVSYYDLIEKLRQGGGDA